MNLNIEGTKHEKAVLVILSYVSGFTAGFIVFGLVNLAPLNTAAVISESVADVVSVVEPEPLATADTVLADATKSAREVEYIDGRLMANANGASVLLSAQLNTVDAETAKAFANQGVHQAIPNYVASEDGAYIYYCEQHSTEDLCTNFMYNVSTGMIQYVTIDGKKAISTSAEAKLAYFEGASLHLGTAVSMDINTPWKLATAQTIQ